MELNLLNGRLGNLSVPAMLRYGAVPFAVLLALTLLWSSFPAFSQQKYPMVSLYRCTRDTEIIEAFHRMADSPGQASLDRIVQKPMRVIFKDMRAIGKAFKNYDALSWIAVTGEHVIFINAKHRTAPPEALAALISHEAMHADAFNSIHEEIAGWREEAMMWREMKQKNPSLSGLSGKLFPLVERLNRIEAEDRNGTLEAFVRGREGYAGLPETSPGYGEHTVSQR